MSRPENYTQAFYELEALEKEAYKEYLKTNSTMKKYKFIIIDNIADEQFEGHPVYRVFSIKANMKDAQLAMISWYKPWKKYVFSSRESCVFDLACLNSLRDFMQTLVPINPRRSQGIPL